MSRPPLWQLPPGVASGTWAYAHSPQIASDYDRFLAGSAICDLDARIVAESLPPAGQGQATLVIDLGCGTGRTLMDLAKRGYATIGVDLSQTMLEQCRQQAASEQVAIHTIRANWVQLDGLRDRSVDHAVSLFSTLGMIQGRRNRRIAIGHVARLLRPGGLFVVHVHNRWAALADPGGIAWLTGSAWRSWRRADEDFGDRVYAYRGLPDMFLHSFSRRELLADLRQAGFRIERLHRLTRRADGLLPWPHCFGSLRAGGYIALAQKQP